MLCQVHLTGVTSEERQMRDYLFFHPYDKIEERDGALVLNYGGGQLCRGRNDFGEACGDCRYAPYMIRRILQRQKSFSFGKEARQ